MRRLSIALVVLFSACSGDEGPEPVVVDDAARAACTRWRDEVLANLGEEEFASSGRFLPALEEIAADAARSSMPGLEETAAEVVDRARAVVTSGEAVGYEDAVRRLEGICDRAR